MPSLPHELPLLIFRDKPEFLLSLLNQALGVELPPYSALRIEETDFTQLEPAQYRADLVITARDEASRPTFALVVEVQRSVDEAKWFSWPVYAGNLHARMRCKTALLVVTFDAAVARWARKGPSTLLAGFRPWVLGPSGIPVITSIEEARKNPEMALLSVHGHQDSPDLVRIAMAAMGAAIQLPEDDARLYMDLILTAIPQAIQKRVEVEMNLQGYEYQSDFARKYVAKGRAEGEAKGRAEGEVAGMATAVLKVLESRGIAIGEEERARILVCTDRRVLEGWLAGAVTCRSARDLVRKNGES